MEFPKLNTRLGHQPGLLSDYQNLTLILDINTTFPYDDTKNSFNFFDDDNYTSSNDSLVVYPDLESIHAIGILISTFLIICCTVSLVVNVVILSSVCFIRSRINNTLYISLSLAAADTFSLFFFALVLFLFSLLPRCCFDMTSEVLNCLYLLIEALRMGAMMTNMFHLAALAFNHYLGILMPLRIVTRRNIQYLIATLWTIPSTMLVMDVFLVEADNAKKCDPEFLTKEKFRMKFAIPFFTTLCLMIFIYGHIYRLVCRHQTQPVDWRHRHHSNQVTKKAIITTILILGSTIVGWLPPFTYYALFCEDCLLCDFRVENTFIINTTLQILLIIKPATNFYIYAFRMKEIRGALRRMKRRTLTFLRHPQSYGARMEMTEMSLTRARSRTSTVRRETFSVRVTSNHDHLTNGVSPGSMTLRRCRSSAMSRHKPNNTSV